MRGGDGEHIMDYVPVTEEDKKIMLERIGVQSIDVLVNSFRPAASNGVLDLPEPLNELDLVQHMKKLSKRNKILRYFVGAGSYNHYIPSALTHLVVRGEFLTSYTPYQAEVSQGNLQAIYEFQSFMCQLTGMDVANASLYDGASALAEAALMAAAYTGRKRITVGNNINPQYFEVLKTYCDVADLEISRNPACEETACVLTQNPDFYGNVENLFYLSEQAHKAGALFVTCVVEATSLAIIEPRDYLLKKMPGRISGMTTDNAGNRGFVLTLQAREQHIRRERATSNITTNVALNALAATVYLALMGRTGLTRVAKLSYERAHLLQRKLSTLGFRTLNNLPFYNEFLMKTPKPSKTILANLVEQNICGGLDLGEDRLLICCTEMNTVEDINDFVYVVSHHSASVGT